MGAHKWKPKKKERAVVALCLCLLHLHHLRYHSAFMQIRRKSKLEMKLTISHIQSIGIGKTEQRLCTVEGRDIKWMVRADSNGLGTIQLGL